MLLKSIIPTIVLSLVLASTACTSSSEIDQIKNGKLSNCPSKTVAQMANGFIENPTWSIESAENNEVIVSVSGNIMYSGSKAPMKIGFLLNKAKNNFNYEKFELNGEAQSLIIGRVVLSKMCDA